MAFKDKKKNKLYSRCDDHVFEYYLKLSPENRNRILRLALNLGSLQNKYFEEKRMIIHSTLYAIDNNWIQ